MLVTAGSTNRTVYFYIVGDSNHANPGDPVTGLLFSDIETGGSASYVRVGAARADFTLVTQTPGGAHTDGGFVEVAGTNCPGLYRCDVPDAAWVTGVDQVIVTILIASANNAIAAPVLVDITDADLRNAVDLGLTGLALATISQGTPPASPDLGEAIMYLYWDAIRAKVVVDTNTANQRAVYDSAGSTILWEADISDASSIFTRATAQSGA